MNETSAGSRVWRTLNALLSPVETLAAVLSGAATMLAMTLTTADALGRYFFGAPLVFQFYFTSHYVLVALIMLALPWGFRTGGYIRVTIVTEHIPDTIRVFLFRLGLVASAAYLALLTWKSWMYFLNAAQKGLVQIEDLNWPVAWSWVWIPLGCGLLTLRILLTAFGPAAEIHHEHDPEQEI